LLEFGTKIASALQKMTKSTIVDEKVVDDLLKEIARALLDADVNVKLVFALRKNIKEKIKLDEMPAGINKRKAVQKAVTEEIIALLDSGKKPRQPKRGQPNVVMFVGLQGSGKTTSVSKMAYYYKRKGWKSCLVCADTFRAGAFDQLKQNATRCRIPYYGSHTETDPVRAAAEGVDKFKEEGYEIIIVDTSGRHKQEADLFEEMQQVAAAIKPDQIIFVMDSSIGQAAHDQAKAFTESVDIGAVIITKLDGHAKGGGALSAVAATKSPIIFLGTGEHMDEFEEFDTRRFVGKLLGMGDMEALFSTIKDVVGDDEQANKELVDRIKGGQFSLRDMYDQFANILKMGPLSKVMENMPGMGNLLKQGNLKGVDSNQKVKIYMTIMDSMTDKELDDPKAFAVKKTKDSRVVRIARGSGRSAKEVNELLDQYKHFQKMMGGVAKMGIGKGGQINKRQLSNMANMMPPGLMQQMGGMGGIQNLMKQFGKQ